MILTRRLESFQGVAAGQQATLRLPVGLSYHQILIAYSGVTLAQMNEIRVVANGKTFMRFSSGSRLDTINQYHGRAAASGVLTIDFTRNNLRMMAGEYKTLLGTGAQPQNGMPEITSLAIEIDIDGAASAPALSAKALQSAPQNLGAIKHVREYTRNPSGAGEFEVSDLPKGHLFGTMHFISSDINSLRIERDGYTVFERTAAENTLIQTNSIYREPQSGVFTFDPSELGDGSQSLQTADVFDLRFILDMAAGGAVPIVVESIGLLN